MDRNREGRRATAASASNMVTTSNGGGTLSRRRHRSGTSLRESTDEDGGVELQESIRLRDRVKKERDMRERDRDRERERERERASRSSSKRRPERPLMNNNTNNTLYNNNNNNRSEDLGLVDDSSEESVNDDEDEEYEENHHHHSNSGFVGGVRLLPPAGGGISNQPLQHRKTFPPSGNNNGNNKSSRVAPVWKSGHEIIGVSVPRKARSAATKRSHDWMPSNSGGGEQAIQQPLLASPARHTTAPTVPVPPMSPSSSNASIRKKLKLSNGSKPRPSKGSSVAKSTSSNPEEIEIEIAEVLFGLMTQQGPSSKKENSSNDSKEENNRSNNDSKSRLSSPISASTIAPPASLLPKNSTSSATPFSVVEPKRKRPRQVPNSLVGSSSRCSPISSTKVEIDQTVKMEVSTSNSSHSLTPGSAAVSYDLGSLPTLQQQPEPMKTDLERMSLENEVDKKIISSEKEEVGCSMKKDSPVVRQDERICEDASASSSTVAGVGTDTLVGSVTKCSSNVVEVERYREDEFQIDLMAPPPQSRMSLGEVDLSVDDKKPNLLSVAVTKTVASTDMELEKMQKGGTTVNVGGESTKAIADTDHVELKMMVESKSHNIDLRLDLEIPGDTSVTGNKLQQRGSQKQQQETVTKSTTKEEPNDEKPGLPSSSSIPMSMPSWPGGLSPMGYMAPLQGAVSMDGGAVPPVPIQMPMFSQPRQKRCATHCYIARNIHYMQQFMKMNPFWSAAAAAASSASLFGSKAGNVSAVPSEDLHGNTSARVVNHAPDNKGQGLALLPLGHGGKERGSQHLNSSDSAQRNQQILLQQAMPSVATNNILGPAFIFPLNQQQAAMAAAVRPGSANSPAITLSSPSNAANSSAVSNSAAGAVPAMSYNYTNMPGNETQYLAILQNNAYPFPIPTVGANPNYRGPHPQPFPLFNGFSYSSQMIHPSQLQQQAVPASQTQQVQQSHRSALLSSSSSHKNLQSQQQTSQGNSVTGVGGNMQQLAAKNRASQHSQSSTNQHPQVPRFRQLDNQMGGGDGPNTADNRGTCATMNMYGQNFAMPMHMSNFAMIPPPTLGGTSGASSNPGDKKHHQSQQSGMKTGIESLPPQTFAMSFGPINGATNPGFDLSMAQNHAIFQNFTDASRHNFQMMAAATAETAHHKKDGRTSEDDKSGGGDHSDCADDERKGLSSKVSTTAGQSIAFSISELPDRSTIQGSHVFESSSRSLNPASASVRASHPSMPNPMVSSGVQNAQLQVQLQHQQHLIQLHKQHQQQLTARSKTPVTTNGSVYPDNSSSSGSISASKYPNALSFPQNVVQYNSSNSPSQSPQWKNHPRTASQNPSFPSSSSGTLKNIPQQPARAPQNLTQISFGSNQKTAAASHRQPPASNQASSPPVIVGSPTTSVSKGASASPRIITTSSTSNKIGPAPSMSAHQRKGSPSGPNQKPSPSTCSGRSVPSILGNPQSAASSPASGIKSQMQQHAHQQQLAKNLQQALFFSNPYMQNQSLQATSTNAPTSGNTGYYLQRRRPDQQQHSPQQPPGSSALTSTGMLSLSGGTTTDPAKAIVAATAAAASNIKGGGLPSQSILNASKLTDQPSGNHHNLVSGGFSYGHSVPAAVQMRPAEEKKSTGNDGSHDSWQAEKK